MKITFHGVRGTLPVSSPYLVRYGGNTPCIEVEAGASTLLVDAGTGMRAAGRALAARRTGEIHLLISHTHWDHIQGFPHFAPLYRQGVRIVVYGLRRADGPLRDIFAAQQEKTFFPVALDEVAAEVEFVELEDGQCFSAGEARVLCRRLNHPGVAGGYRIEHQGEVFSYLSDIDLESHLLLAHFLGADCDAERRAWLAHLREGACDLAHSADLMVFDTFFLPEEYRPDFGHSRPEDALALGMEAEVRRIVLFHHRPDRLDEQVDEVLRRYQGQSRDAVELLAAREGMEITL